MKCEKCEKDFPENEIHLSHDIPRYMDGIDADGRYYLCKRCHDIYERIVPSITWNSLPPTQQFICKSHIKIFSIKYFWEKKDDNNTRQTPS